jgi:predicted TIM-barrel fold metal-dependent hydrolase
VRVIDSDGHFTGDNEGMARFLPDGIVPRGGSLFPPLDHLHSFIGTTPPGSFRQVDPQGWLDFMDDVGIESTVLYGGLSYGKITHRDWAVAVARAYNEWLAETYVKRSPRFQGMALIPMQEPEAAVAELRRAVNDLGMLGAMLPSAGLPNHLGAKEYWPVYEEADRLGCAIAVHGGTHSGFGLDQMNVYTPVGALGHPFGLVINFAGILFNGILDRYPNAKFAFLEGGVSWVLMAIERFDRAHETHVQWNPRGELAPPPDVKVSDYIRKHVKEGRLYIGCEGAEEDLAYACGRVGSEAFMYSSDFPHEVNNETCRAEILELLECEDLTDDDRANITHRNAERFYRLKERAAVPTAVATARP